MATNITYYFIVRGGNVVSYSDYPPEPKFLPKDEKIVPVQTENPQQYLGLSERYLGATKVPSNIKTPTELEAARNKAKVAFYEMKFTQDVADPNTKDVEALYEEAKLEYIRIRDGEIPA